VLSTIASNHTKGLLSTHHGAVTSLISGYHVAFLFGAATIAAGIAVAFVLLRSRLSPPEVQVADTRRADERTRFATNLDTERQAA
jgi:hypothetical protein